MTYVEAREMPAREAHGLILAGSAPAGIVVNGHLSFASETELRELPPGLTAHSLDLTSCTGLRSLPEGLNVRRLILNGCFNLAELPRGLRCYEIQARNTHLERLPDDIQVSFRLDLDGCVRLTELPENLQVGTLILRGCTALSELPEGLDVAFLDLTGCAGLRRWPARGSISIGRLNIGGCIGLTTLPPWLGAVSQLTLSDCESLRALPDNLAVSSWIDIANTGLTSLPPSLKGVQLRWRGVPITERIAFQPETITAEEVLGTQNMELRRVLLERMGYDTFLDEADAEEIHRDRDPGGERRLLRVPMGRDEPLVCLDVRCPSTGRQYVLRVPPTMRTCHQAAAWIAGFDNPDDYRPLKET